MDTNITLNIETFNLTLNIRPVLSLADDELEALIEERNHYAESDDVGWCDLY